MDGNRRWARRHGLEIVQGHRKMTDEMIERLVDHAILRGVKYLTLWGFSTENWNRSPKEVDDLMMLFRELFTRNAQPLHEKGVRINHLGDPSRFAPDIQEQMAYWQEKTKNNQTITVSLALNYGGRDEILRAVQKITKEVKVGNLDPDQKMDVAAFSSYLDTHDLPDPEIIIRPGGEKRLSGFLLWQMEYAELYFPDVLMPDFDEKQLDLVIDDFEKRSRRFGK